MSKRHATEDTDAPTHTLCGFEIAGRVLPSMKIDNADPNCGRCLRVIGARISVAASVLPRNTKIPRDGGR